MALNEWSGIECNAEMIEKWTIGRLLGHLQKAFVKEIDEWVPQYLNEGRRLRNFLIHDYFLSRTEQMGTESGRRAVLKELTRIEQHLQRGADLINGLRVAVGQGMDGRTRPGTEGSEVVFSARLDVEKRER